MGPVNIVMNQTFVYYPPLVCLRSEIVKLDLAEARLLADANYSWKKQIQRLKRDVEELLRVEMVWIEGFKIADRGFHTWAEEVLKYRWENRCTHIEFPYTIWHDDCKVPYLVETSLPLTLSTSAYDKGTGVYERYTVQKLVVEGVVIFFHFK